jgi:hypothetical protein
MTPSIARSPVIEVSAALHAKTPDLVLQKMNLVPEHAKNKIYRRLWEVMDKPNKPNYGESSFWEPTFPAQKKIEAVERVICEDAEPLPDPVKQVQPANSVEVKMPAFWDTGFDPRFDERGNFILESPKKSMAQLIVEIAAYCLFVFQAYCSPWSEVRQNRKAILAGASFENIWSSYYVRALVNNIDDPCFHWIPQAEHDFLEKTGDIFRKLTHSPVLTTRPFPREVIFPIHRMNKPQDSAWVIEKLKPGLENGDLARMGFGFTRLNKNAFTLDPPGKEKFSFDLLEYDYVPHYLFIHATQKSAENLKLACRELRLQLAQTPLDFKSAFSFPSCQVKLRPVFERFNQAWQEYVLSHEILSESQMVWSQVDYRAREYAALRGETKLSPEKADEKRRIKDRPSEQAYDTCQEALKTAYIAKYSATRTGRLLKALHDKELTIPNKV